MDDSASMVSKLETRMTRDEIAAAIGVERREVDEIASGYVPDEEIGERLRELATTGSTGPARRIPKIWIVAFVAFDVLFFAGVAVYVLLQ